MFKKFTMKYAYYYRKASHAFVIAFVVLSVFVSPLLATSSAQHHQLTAASTSSGGSQQMNGSPVSNASVMSSSSSSSIEHVILIMMENKNYQDIIGSSSAPYINKLASTYALATNYYGVQYPSLPNYIDVSSGSDGGITTDCLNGPAPGGCETSDTNIFTLLQNNGLTWKAYEESMPSACYKSDYGTLSTGGYIVHHNPIPYYTDLSSVCSQNDVPLGNVGAKTGAFFTALESNSLPNFSFVTPNSCDDMHNCGVSSGDMWLSEFVPDIINSPSYSTTVTIITWDTGDCSSPCNQNANGGGQVATIVIGPSNLVNYGKFNTFYNHYSTLATIEDIFNLGNLGRNDAPATPMNAIINMNAITTTTTTTSSSSTPTTSSDIWYKVVALPLFNDSMLGASNITTYDPVIPGLGNVYNFVMIVAIIIIMVGAALALILRRTGKQGTDSMIMDIIIGLIMVIAFPSIYDGVARMINYLTQAVIAYPNPYTDYGTVLQILWNNMEFAHGWSLWTLLTNSFFQIVFFIISGIIYIMLFFLGVARIFLIGAMLVAFPLSMGLRLIPFTRKLSSMIDDTLFGLMLASVMSAIVLGVGSYILSPSVWNSSSGNIFFQAVGQNGQNWVAAAALLTAILMPTVLAPLTATIFQTASQVAMTGVGVATMIASGVATGGIGGLRAAGSAVGTLGQTAQIAGQPPPSIAQKLVAGMKAFGSAGLPAIGYNVATLGTAGFVGAVGAGAAGSVMRKSMPVQAQQVVASRAQAQQALQIGQAHVAAATGAIRNINAISFATAPVSNIHVVNPATGAATPNWTAVKLPEGQKPKVVEAKNEMQLKRFANSFPSYQSLSDSLIDNKIITSEASKNSGVQTQIRQLYSMIRGLDPQNKSQSQQLANFHNHLEASRKLGRALKEEDFKAS
jgi:hypothetical protein